MDDDDDASDCETSQALERIARSLNVSAASFFVPAASGNVEEAGGAATDEEMSQALAVMRLFLRLKDAEARARCVSFITQELLEIK